MAGDALSETVLFLSFSPVYGFVTLMHQQVHVVAAHKIGVFDTLLTFAPWYGRHGDATVVGGRR